MSENNMVKTYTPIISAGKGPTCLEPEYAIFDIFAELNEENCSHSLYTDEEINSMSLFFPELLNITNWPDGEYIVFQNYKLIVKTMSKDEFNELPEFPGY